MNQGQTGLTRQSLRPEWILLLAVFVVGCLLILLRKPDVVYNPQFYIEDGRDWYAQAHEIGPLSALFIPHRGYLVVVQRLGAMLALHFPFGWAPLVMSLFGTALDVLPAVFIASSRFARVVPNIRSRLFLALLCLLAPNAWTLMANTTNSMWYLGLLSCFVVIASPPVKRSWRVFDLTAVIFSGLSGPFSIILSPVAALAWWHRRDRWSGTLAIVTATLGLAQAATILFTRSLGQGGTGLGADTLKFFKLLIKRVIYEALFGQLGGARILNHEWGDFWTHRLMLGAVGLLGLGILAYALVRAPMELRLFIVFGGLSFLAAISWPVWTADGTPWWDMLTPAGNGNRYFLIPVLSFLFTCSWMATVSALPARVVGGTLLLVATAVGIPLNFRDPPYKSHEFPSAVARFASAKPGEKIVFMTPPGWMMFLTKKEHELVETVPDACRDATSLELSPLFSNQLSWNGRVGRTEGGDSFVIYGLPSRQYACGVRVTFILTTRDDLPALVQFFWSGSESGEFRENERNSSALVFSGTAPQTVVFEIHDTIDRIRLDPGEIPDSVFEVVRLEVLSTENVPAG